MATAPHELASVHAGASNFSRDTSAVHTRIERLRTVLNDDRRLAQFLGWFSISLGAAELLAPRALGRGLGFGSQSPWLLRACGAREIISGIGILSQPRRRSVWLWSRVGGDAVDLALLGSALAAGRGSRTRVAAATATVAGVTALDVMASRRLSGNAQARGGLLRIQESIAINRSPQELYGFWRNLENLPAFMEHLRSVRNIDDKRSHWIAAGPGGMDVEWDAEIVNDRPNEWIAWRSVGGDVENSGLVRFERGPHGTLVKVEMRYQPPGGVVGAAIAKLMGRAPEQQIRKELRRLKQLLETGEIATTEGQPSSRHSAGASLLTQGAPS